MPAWLKQMVHARCQSRVKQEKHEHDGDDVVENDPEACLCTNRRECEDHGLPFELGELQTTLDLDQLASSIRRRLERSPGSVGYIGITAKLARRWDGDPSPSKGRDPMPGHASSINPRWSSMIVLQFMAAGIPEIERRMIARIWKDPKLSSRITNVSPGGGGCNMAMPGFLYLLLGNLCGAPRNATCSLT